MSKDSPKDVLDRFFENPRYYVAYLQRMIASEHSELTREDIRQSIAKLLVDVQVFATLEEDRIKAENYKRTVATRKKLEPKIKEKFDSMLEMQKAVLAFCEENKILFLPKPTSSPKLVERSKPDWIYLNFDQEEWAVEFGPGFVRFLHKVPNSDDEWAQHNRIENRLLEWRVKPEDSPFNKKKPLK